MKNAVAPRPDPRRDRLLIVDPSGAGALVERTMADLSRMLEPGDVLVVNDAAVLPASLPVQPAGENGNGGRLEIRLAGTGPAAGEWWAVLFGEGSWRDPTERRPPPPAVAVGDVLQVDEDVDVRVEEVSPVSPRLLRLRFDRVGAALYDLIYRYGRPVQYSHLQEDLRLWDVQTRYGARPWAVEMPSAGRPLTWDLFRTLRRNGIAIARVTHAAGLSSTGDASLDARLPLTERYEIPPETVRSIEAARQTGRRVVAVGTTAVRALEGSAEANGGRLAAGGGTTDLTLGPGRRPRIADGILTGMHEPDTSHFALLGAFAPAPLLELALRHADAHGFLRHEFGDSMLVLPGASDAR